MADIKKEKTDALKELAERYKKQGKIEGGPYSLREVMIEVAQRESVPEFPPRKLFEFIVKTAKASPDGLVTYKDCWEAFRPGEEWVGHKSLQPVSKALGSVIGMCAEKGLPVITSVVVRSDSRTLSPEAELGIFSTARQFGFDVGAHSPHSFCEDQRRRVRELVL